MGGHTETGGGTAMALWTMKPNGTRVLVISDHRAYAAAMTEDDPLTAEESERLKAALREMDGKMGHAPHYGPEEAPSAGSTPSVRTGPTRAGVRGRVRRLPGSGRRGPGRRQRLPGPLSPLSAGDHRQGRRPMAQSGPAVMPALRQTGLVERSSCG